MSFVPPRTNLVWLAIFGAFAPYFWVLWAMIQATGGTFEYPLDDPYIHLAISEEIARGGFGVNLGELTWPSSSILYPYLLAPFVGWPIHPYVPALIGAAALLVSAILWGLIVSRAASSGLSNRLALLVAALGPMTIHAPGLALLGMEHALQISATLAVVLGMADFLNTGRITAVLVLGLVLGPLIRYENVAVSGLACGVLLFNGRVLTSILLGAVILAPVVAYSAMMNHLGLGVLPNSVEAKSTLLGGSGHFFSGAESDRLKSMLVNGIFNLTHTAGAMIALIGSLWLALVVALRSRMDRPAFVLALSIPVLLLVHLTIGQISEYDRYTGYLWAFMAGAGLVVVAPLEKAASGWLALAGRMPVLTAFLGAIQFMPFLFSTTPAASAAIYSQQRQMSRFVSEYYQAPVAVNDLGHVSYRNDNYVLDLWGLASDDALTARREGRDHAWASRLIRKHGIGLVMIYDHWLGAVVAPDWTKIATLRLRGPIGLVSSDEVSFYVTRPELRDPLLRQLTAFAPSLPQTATLELFENGGTD